MAKLIGLISDVHAGVEPVREALSVFRSHGVSKVICVGDIAGYGSQLSQTVELLKQSNCIAIQGNHDTWHLARQKGKPMDNVDAFLDGLPATWESVVEGVRIHAVHASPPLSMRKGIRLLDENGEILLSEKEEWSGRLIKYPFDVLVVGHTHQVFAEQLGNKLVINPGSTLFNHTCAILSLPDMEVRFIPLSGKEPVKSWHWGMMKGGMKL